MHKKKRTHYNNLRRYHEYTTYGDGSRDDARYSGDERKQSLFCGFISVFLQISTLRGFTKNCGVKFESTYDEDVTVDKYCLRCSSNSALYIVL